MILIKQLNFDEIIFLLLWFNPDSLFYSGFIQSGFIYSRLRLLELSFLIPFHFQSWFPIKIFFSHVA